MTDIDTEHLRTLAEKAAVPQPVGVRNSKPWSEKFRAEKALANALSPQTVLALLDRIDALEETAEDHERELVERDDEIASLSEALDRWGNGG